jgi:hypothetical protein
MDPDLENVIRQALGVAKATGKDDMGQTVLAVQADDAPTTPGENPVKIGGVERAYA